MEYTLADLGVDEQAVLGTIRSITDTIDAKVKACNQDPRFARPSRQAGPSYQPVRQAMGPAWEYGRYTWVVSYETGDRSTTTLLLYFYPNLSRTFSLNPGMERVLKATEDLEGVDLAQNVFRAANEDRGFVTSNSLDVVLERFLSLIDQAAEPTTRRPT